MNKPKYPSELRQKEIAQEVYAKTCSICPNEVRCHKEYAGCESFQHSLESAMMDEMDPVIHFTEESWLRMKKDANNEDFGDMDCYGTISLGGITADIDLFENCAWDGDPNKFSGDELIYYKPIAGNYLYIRGIDTGYGVDEKNGNMPYALYGDGDFDIPLECDTFQEFKEKLKRNFLRYCMELPEHVRCGTFIFPKDGKLVPGCSKDMYEILAGANGVWT